MPAAVQNTIATFIVRGEISESLVLFMLGDVLTWPKADMTQVFPENQILVQEAT